MAMIAGQSSSQAIRIGMTVKYPGLRELGKPQITAQASPIPIDRPDAPLYANAP
jgi:hypothetical protein